MKKLARALLNYFIKGLLIVVPLGAAFFLIFWAVKSVDNALNLSGVFLSDTKGKTDIHSWFRYRKRIGGHINSRHFSNQRSNRPYKTLV